MKFPHLNRRTHLYLGMFLMPWFFMYGLSSIPFAHGAYFEALDKAKGLPLWEPRFEKTYELEIPEQGPLRPVGAKVLADHGLSGTHGTYRQGPNQVNIYIYSFWKSTQLKYFIAEKKLVAEDRRFRLDHFLTGMHAKGGFEQDGFFEKFWGVMVDVVCLGLLLWVMSGVYMWWSLPGLRQWGSVALAGGIATFLVFLLKL
ncbi:MAG: hypothetical protein R2762_13350 [Bryobacteraceae bacterium]